MSAGGSSGIGLKTEIEALQSRARELEKKVCGLKVYEHTKFRFSTQCEIQSEYIYPTYY